MYVCMYSMRRYARSSEAQPLTSTDSIEYGISGILSTDTAWDSDMIFVCNCDSSWPVGLAAGQVIAVVVAVVVGILYIRYDNL